MDLDEMFRKMEALRRRMEHEMFSDFGELENKIREDGLEGEWRIEPFEEPGMRGFVAKGFFTTPKPLERPDDLVRRPQLGEPREPLFDLKEEEGKVQLYIEMPGVESDAIKLNATPNGLEVDAGDYHASIELPKGALYNEKAETEYKNGVLKITIPKTEVVGL